jgi:RHS repeat-associated protein
LPFRYQGQYEDAETGLYYNRFRYYSPDEGLYISQDPIGLAGGMSLYSYVSDPNRAIDELGLNTNLVTFSDGNLTFDVYNYTNLSHLTDKELEAVYHANDNALNGKGFGISPVDKKGNTIVLHHYRQNVNGPIIAMPHIHHDKPHTNPGQHPKGKGKGAGLTKQERADFNKWKQAFWKDQADRELKRRGTGCPCH